MKFGELLKVVKAIVDEFAVSEEEIEVGSWEPNKVCLAISLNGQDSQPELTSSTSKS